MYILERSNGPLEKDDQARVVSYLAVSPALFLILFCATFSMTPAFGGARFWGRPLLETSASGDLRFWRLHSCGCLPHAILTRAYQQGKYELAPARASVLPGGVDAAINSCAVAESWYHSGHGLGIKLPVERRSRLDQFPGAGRPECPPRRQARDILWRHPVIPQRLQAVSRASVGAV